MEQKHFNVKAWSKFSAEMQEHLLKKFDVILDDHKTKREKYISMLNKFSVKGFQNAMDKLDAGIESWDKAKKGFKIFPTESETRNPFAPDRDYSFLTGKRKDPSEAFWGKRSNKRIL